VNLIRLLDGLAAPWRGGAVAIGNYDGVHRGHAEIVARLVAMARRLGGPAIVLSFDPPPARVLRPHDAPALLSWVERKAELLGRLGVDALVAYPTDAEFLRLEARQFFDRIVVQRLAARGLVEGPDFAFGRQRSGTIDTLRQFCASTGVELEVVEPVRHAGQTVSSSRIRHLIAQGQIAEANQLLTAPYRIRGMVVHGAGRGATLGFPTANLAHVDTLVPAEGIYAGRAWVGDVAWPAAISIGPNPTFNEGGRKIEVFLIDFAGDLYDRTLEVDFLARLRGVQRFEHVEQLLGQMHRDVEQSRHLAAAAQ